MKLELIIPALYGGNQKRTKPLCPPLAPAAVAALTPPEVKVSITDENVTAFFELTGGKNSEQIKIARRLSQETGNRVIATRDDMRFDLKQPSNS